MFGNSSTGLTRFITSRIVLVLELISDVLGITLHHWPARGVNYSRTELHYISRPVGELINNSITSLGIRSCFIFLIQKKNTSSQRQRHLANLTFIVQRQQEPQTNKNMVFSWKIIKT